MLGVLNYIVQAGKTVPGGKWLVTGSNCVPLSSYLKIMTTKQRFKKTGGRQFYHFVQSFSADDDLSHLPTPSAWSESKLLRREALKKLAQGQKLSGDQHWEPTMQTMW